ncbi:heterokaryon incompatibility protein het-E-1 [Fusarium napiforme]|uniref:Heterokaryon incompatibility protein het-E-1 n=1 Tax=Fusarium napiforme TaxID=42672 RepID=A0A8H5K3Q5_9HYPO|nr:heterokaryon incompatibility protein het-E-1 [Fusarium napiforme]
MATNQQTSFERSLDLFRRELSDDHIKRINGVNQKTVTDTIQEIQGKLGRRDGLCKLTRIQRFLQAMEHIEKLVTIFLNASDFVAFIWGPIKLALMVATTWTEAIRQLIDAYEEIAEALGNLAFFHNLIQSRDHLKLVLDDYFSDILRFHRCVLDVFSRPEWKRFFKWAWGSFRREVKPILESLKRKQALLSDDKLQSHAILKEVQDSDQYAKDQFSNLQTSLDDIRSTLASEQLQSKALKSREMKTYMESRLDVSTSRTDLQLESQDTVDENSGIWIFSNPIFKIWEGGISAEKRVLFLNGSPGSGKSTLAKTIIRHQKQKEASEAPGMSFLAYFFFKHNATDRRTARSMLQHVIMQLANADETIMRFAHERLSTKDVTEVADLKELASECFTSRPNATLVLDGLDEAIGHEQEISVKWCLDQLIPAARSSGCHLRILICGQRDGKLDCMLSSHPQIRLDLVDAHQHDIEQFTKEQAAKIRTRFRLAAPEEENLISKIAGASRGMFLYARVVLDNLAAMDSKRDFKDELESDAFPKDLDQAYDRITQRVLQNNRPSRDTSVKRILGWIICAARPLRWREIQSRFCIDAEQQICDIDNLRLDTCKQICSSFVDVTDCELFPRIESEQVVTMVHETATKYLIRNRTINLLQEHIDMALFCCQYLSSRPFATSKSQDISDDIHSGYFGFLDYAAAHYAAHVHEVAAPHVSTHLVSNLEPVKESVKTASADLAKIHGKEASVETGEMAKAAEDLHLAIQDNVLVVRNLISLQRAKSETDVFGATEGPIRHKCQKIQCSKFSTGYRNEAALKEHLAVHERPFRCPHSDCFGHRIGYPSPERLESHHEAFHQSESRVKIAFPSELQTGEWNIHEACKAGNLDEVKRFHREGSDLKQTLPKIGSPLCAAVEAGHGDICQYLVDSGVNPFRGGSNIVRMKTPVVTAIYRQRWEILDFFLCSGDGPDNSELLKGIAQAILANQPVALNMFLTRQPEDHVAVMERVPVEIISQTDERLIQSEFHSTDATLIHTWFQFVKPEFYNEEGKFISQSDCEEYKIWGDLFFRQHNLFREALRIKCFSLATFLMDIGNDELPAHTAVRRTKSQAILRAVLDNTGDFNHRDSSGDSLLHVASFAVSVRMLLENKSVDLFSRNNKGQTAFLSYLGKIFYADAEVEVLDLLFKADPRLAWTPDESEEGLMPLRYASKWMLDYDIGSGFLRKRAEPAKFLLTCSEVKRVLVEYQAKATDADRKKVREFAEKEMLQEALEVMDSIGFNTT